MVYVMLRILHFDQSPAAPVLYVKDRSSDFVQTILTMCPILTTQYVPTLLWGKSGHCQTVLYAKMGRPSHEVPEGVRHTKVMGDGSTLTFDLYEPSASHKTGENYCIIFCPGIGNSSESHYMRVLVQHSLSQGYVSVVLNHLGALKDEPLTAPRLFTYGSTEELGIVRAEVSRLKPECNQVLVGLSMGANIVVKYLGEDKKHQQGVVAAVSFCQGYDVNRAKELLSSWTNLRQGYVMVMTNNQKKIIKRHQNVLLCEKEMERLGVSDCEVLRAWDLYELDNAYTRKAFGFDNLEEFYRHNSSGHYICNVETPMLIVNARDDPIVPEPLLDYPKEAAETLPNCIFALTDHGGHLGYFENGFVRPNNLTWMDRAIIDFANAVTALHASGQLQKLTSQCKKQRESSDDGCLKRKPVVDQPGTSRDEIDHFEMSDTSMDDSGISLERQSHGQLGAMLVGSHLNAL